MADAEQYGFVPWARAEAAGAVERRIGELLRRAEAEPGLSARELAEVAARLRTTSVHRPPTLGRYAVLLAVGMLAGTGFAVAGHVVRSAFETPRAVPSENPARRGAAAEKPAPPATAVRAEPSAGANRPAGAEEPARVRSATPRAAASGALARESLARESELLARALARLRSENDPSGALSVLEHYRSEFPQGALEHEANLARLDALLALDRRAEALVLLERLPLGRMGRGQELRVVRAELLLRGQPARALSDFDSALASPLPSALDERALYGRAASRLALGDARGSEADLATYLARHPHGRYAAEVRERLAHQR